MSLSIPEARAALGPEGRKLSDDQVRQRLEEAHGLARLLLELWQTETAGKGRRKAA